MGKEQYIWFTVCAVSKEWLETLKTGILITTETLKKIAFHVDPKHIKFITFNATQQKLRAYENLPDLWKREETASKDQVVLLKSHH